MKAVDSNQSLKTIKSSLLRAVNDSEGVVAIAHSAEMIVFCFLMLLESSCLSEGCVYMFLS